MLGIGGCHKLLPDNTSQVMLLHYPGHTIPGYLNPLILQFQGDPGTAICFFSVIVNLLNPVDKIDVSISLLIGLRFNQLLYEILLTFNVLHIFSMGSMEL